jgi:hypothetical protein
LNIRACHIEEDAKKVARYISGLRYEIKDEINFLFLRTIEYACQVASKEEEKLARKHNQRNRGRCPARGKGKSYRGRFQTSKEEAGSSSIQSPRR